LSDVASPSFPEARGDRLRTPVELDARGITLRPIVDADMAFLRMLYAQTRVAELASVPWPVEFKQKFLDDQFDLQHRHYVSFFGAAEFLLIEREGESIGRLYLLRKVLEFLIVDITLIEAIRNQGIGGLLIKRAQMEAGSLGRGMVLHVDRRNIAARRLYERLGFCIVDLDNGSSSHLTMRWSADQLNTA